MQIHLFHQKLVFLKKRLDLSENGAILCTNRRELLRDNEITVKLKDIEARNQSVACPKRSNVDDGTQKVLPPKWYGF